MEKEEQAGSKYAPVSNITCPFGNIYVTIWFTSYMHIYMVPGNMSYLVFQSIKPFENKFKEGFEVFWARRGHKDVWISEANGVW